LERNEVVFLYLLSCASVRYRIVKSYAWEWKYFPIKIFDHSISVKLAMEGEVYGEYRKV
jgi:hypothetical protein